MSSSTFFFLDGPASCLGKSTNKTILDNAFPNLHFSIDLNILVNQAKNKCFTVTLALNNWETANYIEEVKDSVKQNKNKESKK